jgi:hypothetical protein
LVPRPRSAVFHADDEAVVEIERNRIPDAADRQMVWPGFKNKRLYFSVKQGCLSANILKYLNIAIIGDANRVEVVGILVTAHHAVIICEPAIPQ